jgi:Spy/CpxP family protein refolding chaperone
MNSKKATALTIVAFVAALSVAAGAVWAQPGGGMGGRSRDGQGIRAVLAKLDLTQDQKDKIKKIAEESKPAVREARERLKADREAMRTLTETSSPDPTALGNAMLRVKTSRAAMRAEMKKMKDATVAVLSPEQRIRFETYLDAARMMRQGRRGGPRG